MAFSSAATPIWILFLERSERRCSTSCLDVISTSGPLEKLGWFLNYSSVVMASKAYDICMPAPAKLFALTFFFFVSLSISYL